MPDASNGPTPSSAVIAVSCVVLVGGLCIAGFAQWFCRHREQSGSSTRDHPVLPISRFIQLQTSEVQKQPQLLPTEDDLNKCLPITDFKTWKVQQLRARANSIKPATQDVLTTVSTFDISTLAPISPAEDPVYLSPLKGSFADTRMSVSNESPKKESRLESSQPPDDNKKYPPAAQQKTTQSASDFMFSNYICAICLGVIEDGVQKTEPPARAESESELSSPAPPRLGSRHLRRWLPAMDRPTFLPRSGGMRVQGAGYDGSVLDSSSPDVARLSDKILSQHWDPAPSLHRARLIAQGLAQYSAKDCEEPNDDTNCLPEVLDVASRDTVLVAQMFLDKLQARKKVEDGRDANGPEEPHENGLPHLSNLVDPFVHAKNPRQTS